MNDQYKKTSLSECEYSGSLKVFLAVLLAAITACGCMFCAAARNDIGVISLKLYSDVDGKKSTDVQELIEIRSDNVVYDNKFNEPVSVSDYAGTVEYEPLAAGRTYFVNYYLSAAEGCTLPDSISDGDIDIECGKGVSVISAQITNGHYKLDDGTFSDVKGLRVYARVTVDGNVFQRIVGFFHDMILKIQAWSLY